MTNRTALTPQRQMPVLLTQKEAALELGIDVKTLCKEVDSGRLPFVLVGKRRKYRLDDLIEYVERQAQWVSIEEKTPEPIGIRSPSTVYDFEEVLNKKRRRTRKRG